MPRKLTATTGVLLALVLVGCGGDDSSKTTSQSAAATTPAATTPATTTSAAKASKSKTATTSKKTDAATTSGSKKKKPSGIGTDSSGPTKEATKKKTTTTTKKTTTTSKKPVGVTPASGSGTGTSADPSDGTGSGPAEDRLAVVAVLRRYYKAFIESNGADACAQLTSEGQGILKSDGGGKSCAESVGILVKRAGASNVKLLETTRDGLHVNDITVTGNNATAQIGPASRLRLVQVSGRWYLRSPNVVNSNTG